MAEVRIALLGDDRGHRSHQELNALRPRLVSELRTEATWVPTDGGVDLSSYDGVWLVPGSPYSDDAAVLRALTAVREGGVPFLGTCGGMQYAVLEFARSVLADADATHAEADGEAESNVVTGLACSLQGEERLVTPVPGTRFDAMVDGPFVGMHFCSYAPSADVVKRLEAAGVVVGATADDAGAEVLEFPGHPFFVTSMFQPHVGSMAGAPIHPLVRAFVGAAAGAEIA
jgi:CTP synthase (UTP-ammonia lyase)